jgi:hypothetical protein
MIDFTYKAAFEELAYYFHCLIEGDDVIDEGMKLLKEFNLVDEDGEWIYNEEAK